MNQINQKVFKFIKTLINTREVNELEKYEDQGVKVAAHTYDVLKISIEEVKKQYGTIDNSLKEIDLFSIIIGVIIHDLSKGSIRAKSEIFSHSQMMLKKPDYIVKESENILKEVEEKTNFILKDKIKKQITHIVVSHHGKWGKIYPSTKEAKIVHRADMYSAKYHRINPISANEILELLTQGYNMVEVSHKIGCTLGVVKDRLKRAKIETNCKNTKHLLNYYKKLKKVPIGDEFFTKRVKETSELISSVETKGFKILILKNEALKYLRDKDVFED